jgi:hypothetical protein
VVQVVDTVAVDTVKVQEVVELVVIAHQVLDPLHYKVQL